MSDASGVVGRQSAAGGAGGRSRWGRSQTPDGLEQRRREED